MLKLLSSDEDNLQWYSSILCAVVEEDNTKAIELALSKVDFEGALLNRLPKCKEKCKASLLNLVILMKTHFYGREASRLASRINKKYFLSDSIESPNK